MKHAPNGHLPIDALTIALAERSRFASVFRHNHVEDEPFAGGVMGWGAPGTWQSMAYGAGLEGPVEEREVDRFCEFYRSRNAEPRIELVPCAHPTLLACLSARGFVIRRFLNEFYRPLSGDEELRDLLPNGWPRGPDGTALEIRTVDPSDEAELRLYAEVAGSGFRPEGTPASEQDVAIVRRGVMAPHMQYFLARFGDVAVAGGGLHAHPACAVLFQASTVPAYRNRGIQAALIAARLEKARGAGSPHATIGSEPGRATERNAMRLGFRLAYTKVVLRLPTRG